MNMKCFLAKLLEFESGISVERYDWYIENYHNKVMKGVSCSRPGRLERDYNSGEPLFKKMSVAQYFENLGIRKQFEGCEKASFGHLQYRVINGWGFVGYQFGESLLITLGYYLPLMVLVETSDYLKISVPKYYAYTGQICQWKEGATSFLTEREEGAPIMVTDTNEWKGTFTGKNGVRDFLSLCMPEQQEAIMRDALRYYSKEIILACSTKDIELYVTCSQKKENHKKVTLSGMLAASHLCGVSSVINYLQHDEDRSDELGTKLTDYLRRFGGHNINLPDLFDGYPLPHQLDTRSPMGRSLEVGADK